MGRKPSDASLLRGAAAPPPPPPESTHPPPRWSLGPSDASVPFLDLNHRPPAVATVTSSLALDRELEMDLEASDNTLRRHDEAAMRVSEHQYPFSSSRLQPFHHMSDRAVGRAAQLFRTRQLAATARSRHRRPYGDDPQWKLVKEHADIRVYRHTERRGKTTTMMAHGMVRGAVAELMDGLYAETTKEARVLYPLLGPAFLDVAVLHVDSYRTAQHPFQFAGVTWMAVETPRGGYGVCKDRDFVCFQKMGMIKDPESSTGEDVGFLTLLSVDQSELTTSASFLRNTTSSTVAAAATAAATFTVSATPEFVRGFLSLTAFFKKLPNGLVSMFITGDFNARGHLAARLGDQMFAELVFALGNAAKCGQAKSLAMLLQSISAGQLPPGGIAASASGSHVSLLLPLLSQKNRDRCGVCSKTLWRVIESPEFCRSCWTRTCRNCHVTMPIYCADFHRAHDDDGAMGRKKLKRLPKPCKETFCLKCVCSVLPNGIKMNAKLLKRTAKKKKYAKKHGGGSIVTDPSILRRGVGRTAASARHVPSGIDSTGSRASKSGYRNGGGSGGSSRNGREPGKLYVPIPRPHHHRSRGGTSSSGAQPVGEASGSAPTQPQQQQPHHHHRHHRHRFDDHSSISALSSVESEKLQRQRLSLNRSSGSKSQPTLVTSQPEKSSQTMPKKQPSSMLEVLENFQLSQQTTTMSADYSEPLNDDHSAVALSYNSYSSDSAAGAIHPTDGAGSHPSVASSRKLELRVNLTPRKRVRRPSSVSSRNVSINGSQTSSKHTNAASSVRHSPRTSGQVPYDDAYYNRALQRYLEKRRSSLRTTSSTNSADHFESLDKASAEATARAFVMGGRGISATTAATTSTSSGSANGGAAGTRDAHKLRILRDLEPFPRTPSFLDRPLTPSRISISSLCSGDFSDTSSAAAASSSGIIDESGNKRPKGEWAPPAY